MKHLNLSDIDQGLPNLDCLTVGELEEARVEFTELAALFNTLATYCRFKVEASQHRAVGRIETALGLESHAETLYQTLPEELRW